MRIVDDGSLPNCDHIGERLLLVVFPIRYFYDYVPHFKVKSVAT
jgi:hypothetical protein